MTRFKRSSLIAALLLCATAPLSAFAQAPTARS